MGLGAAITLILVVDPLGIRPADELLGHVLSRHDAAAAGDDTEHTRLWTCGMHPEVIEDGPGICPICQMDLVPLRTDAPETKREAAPQDQLWSCPMHPTILEPQPGSCPICGMDLVPADTPESESTDHPEHRGGSVVTIDPVVVQNMNVRVEPVARRDLSRSIRTVGHLDYDQERMVSITTRFSGFVEKVHVNYLGQPVTEGEPLFEVYAPELVQTQQELLSAVEYARRISDAPEEVRRRAEKLVDAARTRLEYWEISDRQVQEIEDSGKVLRTVTVIAPVSGVVMKRMHGLEGMAIQPGMDVIHIADLRSLWLTVEVYEDQLPWLDVGSSAAVSFDYFPGETLRGRVRYVEPEVSPTTRTVKLTLEVPNRQRRLRVGMYATVVFQPVVARAAVVVPSQAVIRSGERNIVVVALGEGRFAPREVTLGAEADGLVQIREGLDGHERVVTSAQFLIDSESNLRAAVQKMIAARSGHQH
jgi:Cu(I)/Ag(I) efflux system membrane fusion protein/cobalt-zinc-cadmium efflux system membrane fusion protein